MTNVQRGYGAAYSINCTAIWCGDMQTVLQLGMYGMSASEMHETAAQSTQGPSPLAVFFVKLAAVTCALLVCIYVIFSLVTGFIEEKMEELAILKGGPAFWAKAEDRLYKFAASPDVPPEKKEKIINALRTISVRYKPYIDALSGDANSAPQR